MISNFQDIPTFTSLKSHLLSLLRPKIKSSFGMHDALGLRYLFELRVNLSPLRSHKMRHNFSDTPSETCECNLGIEDIRHFIFECPFYAIQRVTLTGNVIDILQRKNLSHLGNLPELYLYGHQFGPHPSTILMRTILRRRLVEDDAQQKFTDDIHSAKAAQMFFKCSSKRRIL